MSACPHTAAAHFLVAGSSADLPDLHGALERLPESAYGQVILEIGPDETPCHLDLPEGVSLTLLRRAAGPDHDRGERTARAVHAWISEWMCEEDERAPRVIWLGGLSCEPIMRLHQDLRARFPHLHEHPQA